jgi:hypothetical protein
MLSAFLSVAESEYCQDRKREKHCEMHDLVHRYAKKSFFHFLHRTEMPETQEYYHGKIYCQKNAEYAAAPSFHAVISL